MLYPTGPDRALVDNQPINQSHLFQVSKQAHMIHRQQDRNQTKQDSTNKNTDTVTKNCKLL